MPTWDESRAREYDAYAAVRDREADERQAEKIREAMEKAWDEAHAEFCTYAKVESAWPNPYRKKD